MQAQINAGVLTEENGEAVSLTNGESRLTEEEEEMNTNDTDDNMEMRALVSEGESEKVSGTCLHKQVNQCA